MEIRKPHKTYNNPEMRFVGVKSLMLDMRGEGIDMAISCWYPLVSGVCLIFSCFFEVSSRVSAFLGSF